MGELKGVAFWEHAYSGERILGVLDQCLIDRLNYSNMIVAPLLHRQPC
jgi:hypothetical protein